MLTPRRWPHPCRNHPDPSIASRRADHAPWGDDPGSRKRHLRGGPKPMRRLRASLLGQDLAPVDKRILATITAE